LFNLKWKILPKSILGQEAYNLFAQDILFFIISLSMGFCTTKNEKIKQDLLPCKNKFDWNPIKSSYCSKRSPLVVAVLNRRAVLCMITVRVNFVFDISPYWVELTSLAEQQKLLYFLKHSVHPLASTWEQVPHLFTGTLDVEKRDILL